MSEKKDEGPEIEELRRSITSIFDKLDRLMALRPYWGPTWDPSLNEFNPLLQAAKEEIHAAYRSMADMHRANLPPKAEEEVEEVGPSEEEVFMQAADPVADWFGELDAEADSKDAGEKKTDGRYDRIDYA